MSTLRTNALEGVDAKNSITIVAGAGNITTTFKIVLNKVWIKPRGTSKYKLDSLNVATLTDLAQEMDLTTFSHLLQTATYCY